MPNSILLVDEDLFVLDTVGSSLSSDYEVLTADDADSAIRKLNFKNVNMLLVSADLPNKDIFEFIEAVRHIESYINLPIILITEKKTDELTEQAKKAGVEGLVEKPIDAPSLVKSIKRIFAKKIIAAQSKKTVGSTDDILGTLRVLLIDDDLDVLEVMKEKLEYSVHQVMTSSSVDKAIDLLLEKEFDILISDVDLPKKGGFELVAWINDDPSVIGIPIILMSGVVTDVEIIHKAKKLWVDKYLVKPFEFDQLIRSMKEICARKYRINKLSKLGNYIVNLQKTKEEDYKVQLDKLRKKIKEIKKNVNMLNAKIISVTKTKNKEEVSELRELKKIFEDDAKTLQEYINLSQTEYLSGRKNFASLRRSLQKQLDVIRKV